MTREKLLALADELEGMDCREGCRTCPADGTKDSAYDLLPEEDRKAIEWVRKHGGLAAVEKRLMPEGMEWLLDVWPRWSNGEYCKFGDWWKAGEYGEREPQQLSRLVFFTPEQLREWGQDEGENFGYEWDYMRPSDTTYRPDKVEPPAPKVLDADGVEIRVGDTVYVLGFGEPLTVKGFTDDGRVLMSFHDENSLGYKPSKLTHEQPDTWERLEHDAEKTVCEYFGANYDCANCPLEPARCDEEAKKDIIRRAKKLAERGA